MKENVNGNSYKRSVIWIITSKLTGIAFEYMKKIAVMKGKSPFEVLGEMVELYVEKNAPKFTLLTEPELLSVIAATGLKTTRQNLKKWRDEDVLVHRKHWYTDGRNIVYNLDSSILVIQENERAKSSRN